MKKIFLGMSLLLPLQLFAFSVSELELESVQPILSTIIYWSMILVAFITSVMMITLGRKMSGGVFGKVLNYIGGGMFMIFIGFLISEFEALIPLGFASVLTNSFFILGYILIALGGSKLSNAIKS